MPPLYLVARSEATRISYRLLKTGYWCSRGVTRGHTQIITEMAKEMPLLLSESDIMVSLPNIEQLYSVSILRREEWLSDDHLLPSIIVTDWNVCYTDGSLMDNVAASGIYSEDLQLSMSVYLGSNVTIFQAEILAVNVCTQQLLQREVTSKKIAICVDSQAALKSLTSSCIKSKTVRECIVNLNRLAENNEVRLLCVPSHCGVAGNETADELARQGLLGLPNLHYQGTPLSPGIFNKICREWLNMKFLNWWKEDAGELWQTRLLIVEPSPKLAAELVNKTRTDLRLLTGVLTGHCNLNYHMSKLDSSRSPICTCCEEQVETAYHLLCVCPAHARTRLKYLEETFISLESIRAKKLAQILKFLRNCNHF